MNKRPKSSRRYQTGDLTKTLGVSRASLAYYEQMGLVHPERDEKTGIRSYNNEDVFDLFEYAALSNMGLTARQVAAQVSEGSDMFDELRLEDYLKATSERVAWFEALRCAVDRMRSIRLRDRLGPLVRTEYVERYIFAEDQAEGGYLEFQSTDELDLLATAVPIAGFGIVFGLSGEGNTVWRWGRTIPVRHAAIAGIHKHFPRQVGGYECVTMIARTVDDRTPLSADAFGPLYLEAHRLGREPAGEPFVPYIFPPHTGTPYEVCLPLA